MWIAIIPAYNEAASIGTVIRNVSLTKVDRIFLIANGCIDETRREALKADKLDKLKILYFSKALGLDVPKAVGAAIALKYYPKGLLFADGDMTGCPASIFRDLIYAIENGLDLALTNCYPDNIKLSELAVLVLQARENLNKKLGLFSKLGTANPSHGPHAYNCYLLNRLDLRHLAVPPKAMAQSVLLGARIGVGAVIPHSLLGSPPRSLLHSEKIAETIIGDCQEAASFLDSQSESLTPATGYRGLRRFDILENILQNNLFNYH